MLDYITQEVRCLQNCFPRLLTDVETQQNARILTITSLIDGITDGFLQRRTFILLRLFLVIRPT